MDSEYRLLRKILARDGLWNRPFLMMAYAWVWVCPEWAYPQILFAYAEYANDAPERIHADLCYYALKAGLDIGPEQYLRKIKKEVEKYENGIPAKQGSGACSVGAYAGEQAGYADSTGDGTADR